MKALLLYATLFIAVSGLAAQENPAQVVVVNATLKTGQLVPRFAVMLLYIGGSRVLRTYAITKMGFNKRWQSGPLDWSLSVAGLQPLMLQTVGDESVILMDGCGPHVCPDVYAVLILIPRTNEMLLAKCEWSKLTVSGKATKRSRDLVTPILLTRLREVADSGHSKCGS